MAKNDVEEGKAFAFLGVFLGIIGFLIVLLAKKENKYAMYYAKQGLVLTIAYIAAIIITFLTAFILIGFIIGPILYLLLLILWIIGWVNSLSGVEKPIPIIGHFADQFKI